MKNIDLDLPVGAFDRDQARQLNERLARIGELLGVARQLEGNLDARGFRIVNLGNALDAKDALNLRSADSRYNSGQSIKSPRNRQNDEDNGGSTGKASTAGAISFGVAGYVSVQAGAAPLYMLSSPRQVTEVIALVGKAPVGGAITADIRIGSRLLTSITIAAEQTVARVEGKGLASIPADVPIRLDIVSVPPGSTGRTTSPGENFTVIVRLA